MSIICSTLREVIEAKLKSRAAYLEHGIRELLHDREAKGLARSIYEHPLIGGLYGGGYVPGKLSKRPSILARGGDLPSYIPTRNFALALMDIAARGSYTDAVSSDPDSPELSLESMRRNILGLRNPEVQRVLLAAIDTADGKLGNARAAIEAWYDSSMDRVSGWYKRSTSRVIFWLGLAEARATLDSARLPIGWSQGWGAPRPARGRNTVELWKDVLAPVLGLLITALATTMGAPFWFDLLNKVMVIRSTVKPHEKSPEESSEDRQRPREVERAAVDQAAAGRIAEPSSSTTAAAAAAAAATTPVTRATLPPPAYSRPPSPRDEMSGLDGCDVDMAGEAVPVTSDEDLPPAEGGVA